MAQFFLSTNETFGHSTRTVLRQPESQAPNASNCNLFAVCLGEKRRQTFIVFAPYFLNNIFGAPEEMDELHGIAYYVICSESIPTDSLMVFILIWCFSNKS